ncbi:hypothetical protein TRVL_05614 [Trypanosoma vivax]|nr:hypothetical protein TRVL_05614 [Trypanosoma vivax]
MANAPSTWVMAHVFQIRSVPSLPARWLSFFRWLQLKLLQAHPCLCTFAPQSVVHLLGARRLMQSSTLCSSLHCFDNLPSSTTSSTNGNAESICAHCRRAGELLSRGGARKLMGRLQCGPCTLMRCRCTFSFLQTSHCPSCFSCYYLLFFGVRRHIWIYFTVLPLCCLRTMGQAHEDVIPLTSWGGFW